jgi:hypothetical protein
MESPRAANPKKMRAIGFEVEEMMKLFLVIIIGLAVVILIIAASGGISSLLTEFCAKNPAICGDRTPQTDQNVAKASFDALVLAHNCVLNPASCGCIQQACTKNPEDYKQEKKPLGVTSNIIGKGITGLQAAKNTKSVEVKCETQYDIASRFMGEYGSQQVCEQDCNEECKKAGQECTGFKCDVLPGRTAKCFLTIKTSSSVSCTVKNFNIPDSHKNMADDVKDYITGYGDPNFIVYFQNFPQGGDKAWRGYPAWYEKTGEMMFIAMCAADFLRPPLKFLGNKFVVQPAATVLGKIKNIIPKNLFRTKAVPETFLSESMVWQDVIKAAQQEDRLLSFTRIKETFKGYAKSLNKDLPKTIIRAGTYTGVDAVSSYYDALADRDRKSVV